MKKLWIMPAITICIMVVLQDVHADELFHESRFISLNTLPVQESSIEDPAVIRQRYVILNFPVLHEALETMGEIGSSKNKPTVTLDLFADASFQMVLERVEIRSSFCFTCFGSLGATKSSQTVFVVEDKTLAGNIRIADRLFQIRPEIDGIHHVIREIDQGFFPNESQPIPVHLFGDDAEVKNVKALDDYDLDVFIDVIVVYTADAAAASGNINTEIQLAVDETNAAYGNSVIVQRLRLVYTNQVSYTETGNFSQDLARLQNKTDGYLDEVHPWRDSYVADMVSLWVEGGGYCGIAYLMTPPSTWFESWAFSVIKRSCATGYFSYGHELGHNMGAQHDRANAGSPGAYDYSYGYQDPNENWRTIMAYNCPGGCPRVQESNLKEGSLPGVTI